MNNTVKTSEELTGMSDSELRQNGYERKKIRRGGVSIRRIQSAPQELVAKLEEISPETIISDAIFPPKLKANDYSLFAGYFLQQVLDVYISRIQSTGLLRDDDIQGIIEILEFYDYQAIQSYILKLPDSQAGNNLSMKNSQLLKKITLDDRVKTISEVVCTLKYKLESWQRSSKI